MITVKWRRGKAEEMVAKTIYDVTDIVDVKIIVYCWVRKGRTLQLEHLANIYRH